METGMDEQTLKDAIKSERSSLQAELEVIRADRRAFAADLEELRRERALLQAEKEQIQAEKDQIRAEKEALEADRKSLRMTSGSVSKAKRKKSRVEKEQRLGVKNHVQKAEMHRRNPRPDKPQAPAPKADSRVWQKFVRRQDGGSRTLDKGRRATAKTSSLGEKGTPQQALGPTTRQKGKREFNREEEKKEVGQAAGEANESRGGEEVEAEEEGDPLKEDLQEEDFQEDAQGHSCERLVPDCERSGEGLEELQVSFGTSATSLDSPAQPTEHKGDLGDLDGGGSDHRGSNNVRAAQGVRQPRSRSSTSPRVCQHCGKSFRLTSRYLAHLDTHTDTCKRHQCSKCTATFAQAKQLMRHVKEEHSDRTAHPQQQQQQQQHQHTCSICGVSFTSSALRRKHTQSVHRKAASTPGARGSSRPQVTCAMCGESFSKPSHLAVHMGVHSEGKPFKCPHCRSSFTSRGNLTVHLKKHRGDKPFKCQECGATFPRQADLKSHARKHSTVKPYKCGICSAAFCRAGDLKPHMRTHTGEKPFQCERCGAAFSTSSNLAVHRRTHSGERPFQCEQCGDAFSQLGHLTRHRLQHATEHSHPCPACSATFGNAYHLKVHMQRHNTENTYKCKCGAAFSRASILTEHMRIHTGEKPYKCTQCPAAFARSANLAAHRRKHTGERPYCCPHCRQCFTQSTSLNRHLQSKNACLSRRAPTNAQLNCAEQQISTTNAQPNNAAGTSQVVKSGLQASAGLEASAEGNTGLEASAEGNTGLQASAGGESAVETCAGDLSEASAKTGWQSAVETCAGDLSEASAKTGWQSAAGKELEARPVISRQVTNGASAGHGQLRGDRGDTTAQASLRGRSGGRQVPVAEDKTLQVTGAERERFPRCSQTGPGESTNCSSSLLVSPLHSSGVKHYYDDVASSSLDMTRTTNPSLGLQGRDLFTPPASLITVTPGASSPSTASKADSFSSRTAGREGNGHPLGVTEGSNPAAAMLDVSRRAEGVFGTSSRHKFGFCDRSENCAVTHHVDTSSGVPVVAGFSSSKASLPPSSYQLQHSPLYVSEGSSSFGQAGGAVSNGCALHPLHSAILSVADAAQLSGSNAHMVVSLGGSTSSSSSTAVSLPPPVAMVTDYENGGGGSSAESLLALRELSQSASYFQPQVTPPSHLSPLQCHPP